MEISYIYICMYIYICNLLIGNFAGNGNFHHLRAHRDYYYVDNMCICIRIIVILNITGGCITGFRENYTNYNI